MQQENGITKIVWINTLLFFCGWTLFFYSGADHPPPIGFFWIVFYIVVLDVIQYVYLKRFIKHLIGRKKGLFAKNLLFFIIGGVFIATLICIQQYLVSDEMSMLYILFWMGLLIVTGILYGIYLWFFNSLLLKVFKN